MVRTKAKRRPSAKTYRKQLILKTFHNVILGIFLIFIVLCVGMSGYHFLEGMPWIDSFLSASMILSGMGPTSPLVTFDGKLFAGCYALFSGLFFILIIGLIFAPLASHYFRIRHLEMHEY